MYAPIQKRRVYGRALTICAVITVFSHSRCAGVMPSLLVWRNGLAEMACTASIISSVIAPFSQSECAGV